MLVFHYSGELADYVSANEPIYANDGRTPNVVVITVPVIRCGARGPGHLPHRSGDWRNETGQGFMAWTFCPGDDGIKGFTLHNDT